MIHVLVGVGGAALILAMLGEFFVTFLLPRRVRRDPRLARGALRLLWRPWRAGARLLSPAAEDTALGFFGPVALILELTLWTLGLVVGYTLLQWAFGSHVGPRNAGLGEDLYFSGGDFLSAATADLPIATSARVLGLLEAATGIGVLFIVIGYLPAIYGAFSRREIAVSQLDPRAGSPPSAGTLLRRLSQQRGEELDRWLRDAESWAAELMETQLSYPLLAWYRSQHVNQNWLSALTVIVDASAVVMAARPEGEEGQAELTYAVGRHALSDIAVQFSVGQEGHVDRLRDDDVHTLHAALARCEQGIRDEASMRGRLDHLRAGYEGNAARLAELLALPLPRWTHP